MLSPSANINNSPPTRAENSYKYTVEEFKTLATLAGFESIAVWTDDDDLFSVHYFEVV